MQIKDAMSHPVVTCHVSGTLDHAARLMWEFDCGIVPIIDNEGRLAGVVTDRDICMAAYTQGRPIGAIPVTTAMGQPVVAVHSGDAIERAQELMQAHQVRRLPVLDHDDRPVGLISMSDLARLAARARKSGVDRQVVTTLAAVSQPRTRGAALADQAVVTRPALAG